MPESVFKQCEANIEYIHDCGETVQKVSKVCNGAGCTIEQKWTQSNNNNNNDNNNK